MESMTVFMKFWSMLVVVAAVPAPAATQRCPSELAVSASGSAEMRMGEITLSASGAVGSGKPWVDNFAAFSNSIPHKHYIVGRSDSVSVTHQEAAMRAARDAAGQIYPLLEPYLSQLRIDRQTEKWVVDDLAARINSGKYVVDRYTQSSERRYGQIWSHAVLVEVPSARLRGLGEEYRSTLRHRQVGAGRTVASIAGLSVLILLTYALVNAWTKGYFRGRLRAGAVIILAAGASVLIWAANLGT
jgi:hypothetical protein